ncbi:MAG TPA: acetylxylan esterase, partial [Anaerovoracaceae bacterium]|nr:acetylxylan esterase [Anaerovoracaceae bacterium]
NAQNELNVIRDNWLKYSDAPNSLYHYLTGQAYDLLKERSSAVSGLGSLSEWQQRQRWIKESLLDIVGPFPEKNPLNAKVLRVVEKDGYRIEHIVYESQPGFFVTSSLFVPGGLKKRTLAPAVIYCSGHSAEGYRSAVYLHIIVNLVKKGFIVFAFDPVGQGERYEYLDTATGKSLISGIGEHSYSGVQAFITGSSQARYMIWDGIRAVDYLLTRKEVDPARIGITGRSGGGTQSAYIAAMDDRIYAAAPENYLTNFTRLLQTIGPQDAEQNMFNIVSRGLDHPDYLIVRAPKPALMITTTRDMFSIQGVLETEKEVSRIYKAYGKESNFSRVEDDAPHASTIKNREAMYAFFQKHLNNPGNPEDLDTQPLSPEDVKVTSTGQVYTSLGGETVFSLNRMETEKLVSELQVSRGDLASHLPKVLNSAKKLSGYREPSEINAPVFTGRFQREGYVIEKYFVKGEGDYVIPYLLMRPDKPNNKALIYLHPSGKSVEASVGGEIEWFVRKGFTVLAPDMIGVGETGSGDTIYNHAYIQKWYASMLIGRSIAGIRAGDLVMLTMVLKRDKTIEEVFGLARKEMCPVLLYAAAFNPGITHIALIEPYSSYRSIVMNRFYNIGFIYSAVPAALKAYDIPDLAAILAPRKLLIAGVTDGLGGFSDSESISDDLEVIRKAFLMKNAEEKLNILTLKPGERDFEIYLKWIN